MCRSQVYPTNMYHVYYTIRTYIVLQGTSYCTILYICTHRRDLQGTTVTSLVQLTTHTRRHRTSYCDELLDGSTYGGTVGSSHIVRVPPVCTPLQGAEDAGTSFSLFFVDARSRKRDFFQQLWKKSLLPRIV